MDRTKLEKHIKEVVMYHYGWELWASRPESGYNEGVQPFITELADVVEKVAAGKSDELTNPLKHTSGDEDIRGVINIAIGNNLRRRRLEKCMSLQDVAKSTGINVDYYADIEHGASWMRMWELERVLGLLKIKSSDVLPF